MRKLLSLAAIIAAVGLFVVPYADTEAQRRPGGGKGGKGGGKGGNNGPKWPKPGQGGGLPGGIPDNPEDWGKLLKRLPSLKIEDVKPDGVLEVYSLLPTSGSQPRLGVSTEIAYRMVDYSVIDKSLKFVVLDLKKGEIETKTIKLPKGAPEFKEMPLMSYDGGKHAVVSHQAAVMFVDVKSGKVRVSTGFDESMATEEAPAPRKKGKKGKKTYTGNGAIVHSADGKKINLSWDHGMYGLPPADRDAVFAVTEDEVVVLTVKPQDGASSSGAHDLSCIVFDHSGIAKEVQKSPEPFAGSTAKRFGLSPDGQYIVAHMEKSMHQNILRRGSWDEGYKTSYHDPLVGFIPDQQVAVFLENDTPEMASLKAINLASGEVVWKNSLPHEDVRGDGEMEPFTAISAGGQFIAAQWGIFKGQAGTELDFVYKEKAADFVPLSIAYDQKGKSVGVLTCDRIVVFDAKSHKELNSIALPKQLPERSLGEFISFDKKGTQLMACARNLGAWLIDLKENKIIKELKDIDGTWVRALPDFSGVVYSQSAANGGNVMLHKFDKDSEQFYDRQVDGAQAVCLWIGEKSKKYLVAERGAETPKVSLISEKGKAIQEYEVGGAMSMLVGDKAVTGFVTKKNEAVLINEVSVDRYTGVNCTILNDSGIKQTFSATFKTEELPGSSTYGDTAASPFFGIRHGGSEKSAYFACPAGVLHVDVSKSGFTLHAWSRSPKGLAAVSPKGKEFFVAGAKGLTTYKIK
ncbi:MAG: hypothetical protein ACYTDT_14295 [Planctomycetota bacterium]|jgi:hypothetical protein